MDTNKVFIGSPELVTGAAMVAPIGTKLPTASDLTLAGVTLDSAFEDAGYIGEDGLTLSFGMSTGSIKDWGLRKLKDYMDDFDGKVTVPFVETSARVMKLMVGEDYVEEVKATASDGTKTVAKFGPHLAEPNVYVFKIKDGSERALLILPNATVTNIDDIDINATSAISWNADLSASVDESGNSIILITDDGIVAKNGAVSEG